MGARRVVLALVIKLAEAKSNLGNDGEQKKLLKEGLIIARDVDDSQISVTLLEQLALSAQGQEQTERSTRLLGATGVFRTTLDFGRSKGDQIVYDDCTNAIRAKLSEKTFASLWEEGQAMSLDEAVKYALSENE